MAASRGRGGVLNEINTPQLTKTIFKKYSAKCVISGDHAETYEYHKARTGAKPGKHTQTGERRKREARFDNIFRAMREVKRLVNSNAGRHCQENRRDKFLTLTFAENITDIQQANRYFDNFFKKLRYHYGAFKYISVPQIQWKRYEKYGVKVWHYHVAGKRVTFTFGVMANCGQSKTGGTNREEICPNLSLYRESGRKP